MNIAVNTTVSKLFVAFVAVAMLFTVAAPAKAATVEELQAQIAALMAQISSLSGGSSAPAAGCTFTRALTTGSTGADVTCLQNYLIGAGHAISAGATGYFGSQTAAAVASWQAANGVTPAAGYFGPVSQAKYNALMAMNGGGSTPGSDDSGSGSGSGLGNDEGSISVSSATADESGLEEATEGGVLAFDVEVEGDVEIDRMDVYVEVDDSTTASDNADDYFVRAFLLVDGEEVAEVDVDDFDEDDYTGFVSNGGTTDDEYRIRFSNLGLVFEDNDEPEFQVGFEVVKSLDSSDLAADWYVAADEIRFVDGKGFSDTEDANQEESFDFDEEETAELRIKTTSDNPDATTLLIDDQDDESDEFDVFVFEIEERNGVDVTIDELRFTILTTGSTTESDVVDEAILYQGSTELGSESVPDGGVVDFDNLDIQIDGDSSEEFTVALVFKGAEDHGNASDVKVTFTSVRDAEDANGNDEGEMDISGTPSSETHSLRTVVPEISDTSFDVDRNEAGDAGVISFTFTVGAEDDDFDLTFGDVDVVDGSSDDIRFSITGGDLGANATATVSKLSGDATANGSTGWTIADGDEATFVLDVVFASASAAGAYRVTVDTVGGIEVDMTSSALNI